MGEMADFYIDQTLDAHPNWSPTRRRRLHNTGYTKEHVSCKYCGAKDLIWKQKTDGRWVVHRGNKLHVCKPKDNNPEGFDDVP